MKKFTLILLVMFTMLLHVNVKAQNVAPALLTAQHELMDSNVYLSWWEPGTSVTLHYDDGTYYSAIGTNEEAAFDVAMRFDPEDITSFDGMEMTNFSFVPVEASATYVVKVWIGENADSTIYTDTLSSITDKEWNTVAFNTPLILDATKTYYFGYHVNTPTGYPAGCDNGPSIPWKSDLIRFDSVFVSLSTLNADLIFNWNMRVDLEVTTDEKAPTVAKKETTHYLGNLENVSNEVAKYPKTLAQETKGPSPDSYKIYRNDAEIATSTEAIYNDVLPASGVYNYTVSAVYGTEETEKSNEVSLLYDNSRVLANSVVSMGFINAGDFSPNNGVSVFKGLVEIDYENEEAAPIIFHSATAILGQDPFATAQTEELFMHYFIRTFSFPAAYFNGITYQGGGSGSDSMYEIYQPLYDEAKNTLTPVAFESSLEKTGSGTYNLHVKADKVGVYNNPDLQLVTVLTQERIEYTWAQEEIDEVRFVATEVFPSTFGTPIQFVGDSVAELDIEVSVDPFEPAGNYRVVTYIQDTNSLYILNADYLTLPAQKKVVFEVMSEGVAVEGASIATNDGIIFTDETGYANVLIYDNLGMVDYEVSKEDYDMVSGTFDVVETDTVFVALSLSVGIQNNAATKSVLYPNPANDVVNISSTRAVSVNIFDVSGKLLQTIASPSNQHTISTSHLDAGVYYIQLFDGINNETIKLFKE